jgi:eukaryotic-like serine/threonine-protein kinase
MVLNGGSISGSYEGNCVVLTWPTPLDTRRLVFGLSVWNSVTIIRNRYELEAEIGSGATCTVWVALDRDLRRRVAIKILQAEYKTADWRERFETEALTIAELRSPHIVQVFDAGVEDEVPFIVMELLEGETLEQRLTRRKRFSLTHAAIVLGEIAKGLSVTHLAGIVHRDLKPANVFLAREGDREVVKLLDFGIAIASAPSDDTTGTPNTRAGTPWYMSPEQFDGKRCRVADDIWALAVLAYELVTGSTPFQAASVWQLRRQIGAGAFRPACEAVDTLPALLDTLFTRSFASDPRQRFASCQQLVAEFTRICEQSDSRTTRVLVLDDEPDMELLLRKRFQHEIAASDFELCFGRDGEEGLAMLRERPDLDVILTDINMPGMDGLTFLTRVPEINKFARVIVVTAYNDMANIRTAMNRGAFDFLCKPIDFSDLKSTVLKCYEHVRTLRQAFSYHRENALMKLLIDGLSADKVLNALAASQRPDIEHLEGAVASISLRGLSTVLDAEGHQGALAYVNSLCELVLPEIAASQGRVIRLCAESVVAIFSGTDHLRRAAEACMTICDELTRRRGLGAPWQQGTVAIGLDVGEMAVGTIGSVAQERIGQAVIGANVLRAAALGRRARGNAILASVAARNCLLDDFIFENCQADGADIECYYLTRRMVSWPPRSGIPTEEYASQDCERPQPQHAD